MKKAAICGFYGHGNIGDDMMQFIISDKMRAHGYEPVCYSSDTIRRTRAGINDWADYRGEEQVVVFGGGGIIDSNFYPCTQYFLDRMVERGQKLVILNVDVFDQVAVSRIVNTIPGEDIFWAVRNGESWLNVTNAHLNSGSSCRHIHQTRDITMDHMANIVASEPAKQSHPRLVMGFNAYAFRHFFGDGIHPAKRAVMATAEFVKWMESFGWSSVYIPAQAAGEANDVLYNALVSGHNRGRGRLVYDPLEGLQLAKTASLMITTRYHHLVFAIANKIPFIDLTHHSKNRTLIAEMGLDALSVPMEDVSIRELKRAAEWAKWHTEEYQQRCLEIINKNQENWVTADASLAKFLNA